MLPRLVAIVAAIAGMVFLIALVGPRLHSLPAGPQDRPLGDRLRPIAAEAGVFRTAPLLDSLARTNRGAPDRRLPDRDGRRAYPGAPPVIPHPLTAGEMRAARCGTCHGRGGYVERFGAYAPPTPHPELSSCLQCHVPQHEVPLFVASNWEKVERPRIGGAALPGSPPPIPHDLQMRENCLACHGSPSAPPEIRTKHPERINCRQCHVPRYGEGEFIRAGTDHGNGR